LLKQWKRRATEDGKQAFPGHGNLKAEEAELRRLRREVEILRQERDILKKAMVIFSQGPK
jgi:transposase